MAKYVVEYSGQIEVDAECELEAECVAATECSPDNCRVIVAPISEDDDENG